MSNLQKKIIFKKFKVGKLIFNSELASIYEGKNELNGEQVAMKFEKISGKNHFLESEAYILFLLKGIGIPKIISYGKIFAYNVLIEELLGESVYLIWKIKRTNMKKKLNDICLIALQCLDRLEYVHSKDIIHRDIKPFNFLFGKKDQNLIYLIDFGLAKKYRSSRTGKHIKFTDLKMIYGSCRYMSLNAIRGYEQSRRDDLESLGYMLVFLIKKTLPWLKVEKLKSSKSEIRKNIYKLKSTTPIEEICSGLPSEFCDYINYCRKLAFEEDPDYNYLRNLFYQILKKNEQLPDIKFTKLLHFSWLKEDQNIKIKKIEPILNKCSIKLTRVETIASLKNRKDTHKRLYRQIKDSIEKAKSEELPSIRNNNFFKFDVNNINIILNNIDSNTKNKMSDNALCNNKNIIKIPILHNQKKEFNKKLKSPPPIIKRIDLFSKNSVEKIPLHFYNKINKIKDENSFKIKNTIIGNKINFQLNSPNNTINYTGKNKIKFLNLNEQKKNGSINLSFSSFLNVAKGSVYKTLKEREKEKYLKTVNINNEIKNKNTLINHNQKRNNKIVYLNYYK